MKKHTSSSLIVSLTLTPEKEQKTEEGKKGARFFFYGQIDHDEY
jgi:hypothetical protein